MTDKHLLALKCLSAAHAVDPSHPSLHLQLLKFRKALDSLSEPLPAPIAEVVNAEFEKLLPKTQKLDEWNESFLTANKDSVTHVQAALSARQLLNPDSKAECEKDLLATLDSPKITLDEAAAAIDLLNKWGSDNSAYVQKANKKWPEATVFLQN